MAELVDALDSKSSTGDSVRVRVSLPAPSPMPLTKSRMQGMARCNSSVIGGRDIDRVIGEDVPRTLAPIRASRPEAASGLMQDSPQPWARTAGSVAATRFAILRRQSVRSPRIRHFRSRQKHDAVTGMSAGPGEPPRSNQRWASAHAVVAGRLQVPRSQSSCTTAFSHCPSPACGATGVSLRGMHGERRRCSAAPPRFLASGCDRSPGRGCRRPGASRS